MKRNAVQSLKPGRGLTRWRRLPLALVLLSVAAFSAFGFLATFEPNPWWKTWPWRIGYAVAGPVAVAGVVLLWKKRRQPIA